MESFNFPNLGPDQIEELYVVERIPGEDEYSHSLVYSDGTTKSFTSDEEGNVHKVPLEEAK